MGNKYLSFFLIASLFSLSSLADGRWLTTSFVQAYLPSDWNCIVKNKQWECKRDHLIKAREATILLSAKIAGPEDTLTTYKSYLSRPIQPPGRNSKSSKVLGVAEVSINQHKWIDGYHLGSELQTWNSRYLATTKDGLAILISFSNHSAKSKEYKPIFARIVSSLRVNLQSSVKESLSKIQKPINAPTTMPSPTAPSEDLEALKGTESLAQNPMVIYLGIALIIVTILALLFFPKKKKNKL